MISLRDHRRDVVEMGRQTMSLTGMHKKLAKTRYPSPDNEPTTGHISFNMFFLIFFNADT
jgi:hypothetical protein